MFFILASVCPLPSDTNTGTFAKVQGMGLNAWLSLTMSVFVFGSGEVVLAVALICLFRGFLSFWIMSWCSNEGRTSLSFGETPWWRVGGISATCMVSRARGHAEVFLERDQVKMFDCRAWEHLYSHGDKVLALLSVVNFPFQARFKGSYLVVAEFQINTTWF